MLLFGPEPPVIVGVCGPMFAAAREHHCPCEWGSRELVLGGADELMTTAETALLIGWRNAAAQGETPKQEVD